jgi:hypothetical protein
LGLVPASLLNFLTLSTVNWSSFAELTFKLSPGHRGQKPAFGVGMGLTGLYSSLKAPACRSWMPLRAVPGTTTN